MRRGRHDEVGELLSITPFVLLFSETEKMNRCRERDLLNQAVFERLHTSVPTAQLYNFTTETNSKFTDPYPANIWDYKPYTPDPPLILGAIAIVWAGLLAILIALNWEARTLISIR